MGNRTEAPLCNQTFRDVTAWRGIRNAERSNVVLYPLAETPKPINRIAELNQELKILNALSSNQNLTSQQRSQCKLLQQQRRGELFEEMAKAGNKPIRTKGEPRCF